MVKKDKKKLKGTGNHIKAQKVTKKAHKVVENYKMTVTCKQRDRRKQKNIEKTQRDIEREI